ADRFAVAVNDPAKALTDAVAWNDTARSRDAIVLAFERLARRDSDQAETQWARLGSKFPFGADQRGRVLRALPIYPATSYAPDARARLDALPAAQADDTTREWRVRVALASQDFAATLTALDAMPPAQLADPRWRYLRARALVKLGRDREAAPLFAALA